MKAARFWRLDLFCLFILGAVMLPGIGQATVSEFLSIAELQMQSSFVVRARVTHRAVMPQRGPKGEIYTHTDLVVSEYLSGQGPDVIRIQQLGGQLDGVTLHLEGNAEFAVGDEVIAFLDHDPLTGLSYVVGLAQGVFVIQTIGSEEYLTRDLDGLAFYTAGAAPYAVVHSILTVPDFQKQLVVPRVSGQGNAAGGLNQ